jgi:hypothetical protein
VHTTFRCVGQGGGGLVAVTIVVATVVVAAVAGVPVAKIVPVVIIALPHRHTSLRNCLYLRARVLKVNINKIGRTRYIGPTTGAKWTAFRRMGARVIAGCERALGRVVGSNLEIITENNQ